MKSFISLLLSFFLVQSPRAQSAMDSANANARFDSLARAAEIVITAMRSSEKLLEVPLAVSVVDRKTLENTRGYGFDEVLSGIPGVLAQSRYGNQDVRLTIRGFGARGAGDRSNAGTSRGIRVMADGIPDTEPDGRTSFDLIDLSGAGRIEVIRSNASAIWGNAAGGVVNVVSNSDFDAPYLRAQTMFGSFGFQKQSVQGGALLGNGRFFFSANIGSQQGWREQSSSAISQFNGGFLSDLSPRAKLGVHVLAAQNLFRIPGPLSEAQFDAKPEQANPVYAQRDERRLNRLGRVGVTLAHEFDDVHSISAMTFVNPKFLQRSERGTFRDFTRYHFGGNFVYKNSISIDHRVKLRSLAGIDEAYQDGAILFYSLAPDGTRGRTLQTNQREGANTFGAFAQSEIILDGRLSLLLGARYDNVTYINEDFINPTISGSKSFQRLTPKAGLNFQFSETQSAYANVGGGVEVPAGNEVDPVATFGQDSVFAINPLLDPIVSTTFEIGTKQILSLGKGLFQRLTYDVAAYWISVQNDIVPYRGGRFYFTAGQTRRVGVELGASLQLDYGVSLQTSLTLSDNRYVNYIVDSVHYGRPGRFADYANNQSAGVPSLFYNVKARYEPLAQLFFELAAQGVGRYFVDDANATAVPAYAIFNATIGLNSVEIVRERLYLQGFLGVNNLTNAKYAASAFINPDVVGGAPLFLEPGLPRNFTGSLGLRWTP